VNGTSETGKASWYDHRPGICAHKTLPFGTVVTVTDVDRGTSVQCTVGDRGPYVKGWIIDLNPREFNQLAPQSAGVINVRITW
jgi:rare lipoprotein A